MYIMVLADGETFSTLDECFITRVPDGASTEDIEEMLDKQSNIFQVYFEVSNEVIILDMEKNIPFQFTVE